MLRLDTDFAHLARTYLAFVAARKPKLDAFTVHSEGPYAWTIPGHGNNLGGAVGLKKRSKYRFEILVQRRLNAVAATEIKAARTDVLRILALSNNELLKNDWKADCIGYSPASAGVQHCRKIRGPRDDHRRADAKAR
jgi:hypothetical protein